MSIPECNPKVLLPITIVYWQRTRIHTQKARAKWKREKESDPISLGMAQQCDYCLRKFGFDTFRLMRLCCFFGPIFYATIINEGYSDRT